MIVRISAVFSTLFSMIFGFLQVEVCVFVFDIMFFNGEQYVSFTHNFYLPLHSS